MYIKEIIRIILFIFLLLETYNASSQLLQLNTGIGGFGYHQKDVFREYRGELDLSGVSKTIGIGFSHNFKSDFPLRIETGLNLNQFEQSNYSINTLEIPLRVRGEVGRKFRCFLGFGIDIQFLIDDSGWEESPSFEDNQEDKIFSINSILGIQYALKEDIVIGMYGLYCENRSNIYIQEYEKAVKDTRFSSEIIGISSSIRLFVEVPISLFRVQDGN